MASGRFRWLSSTANDSGSVPGSMGNQATSSAAPVSSVAADSSSQPSSTLLEEQLKRLTKADQELIMNSLNDPSSQKASRMGGPGIGPAGAEMVAAFTCGQCDFRMVKRFSKHAYTKGIVVVECPSCRVKHLLADNLGWWEGEATNIEEILKAKGESFVHLGGGDYESVGDAKSD